MKLPVCLPAAAIALGLTVTAPAAAAPTPAPVLAPAAPVLSAPGYYLMQGSRIVSPPYASVAQCTEALAKLQARLPPGTPVVVCAHRRP
jgi:hypothetical protein